MPLAIETKGALERMLVSEQPDVVYWRKNTGFLQHGVRESWGRGIPFVFAGSELGDTRLWTGSESLKKLFVHQSILDWWRNVVSMGKAIIKIPWYYRLYSQMSGATVNNGQHLSRMPVKKKIVIRNTAFTPRAPFSWPRPFVLWVANISPKKRPRAAINLAKELLATLSSVDFLMMGRIYDLDFEEELRRATEMISNLHYLGPKSVAEVNGACARALFLLSTAKPESEGFSNVFIQAWAQGCPTLSLEFDPDGCIERYGLGFVAATQSDLIEKAKTLLNQSVEREAIGSRARHVVNEMFGPENTIVKLERFLEEIVAAHKAERCAE